MHLHITPEQLLFQRRMALQAIIGFSMANLTRYNID